MKILVSACLLGRNCKYNGGNNRNPLVLDFVRGHEIVAVCPEVMAGLGIPRRPVEIVDGVVRSQDGTSFDAPLRQAVEAILEQVKALGIDCAVLQSRSPTCGVRQVYDGTFTGTRVDGSGVLAQALAAAGVNCVDAEDLPHYITRGAAPQEVDYEML